MSPSCSAVLGRPWSLRSPLRPLRRASSRCSAASRHRPRARPRETRAERPGDRVERRQQGSRARARDRGRRSAAAAAARTTTTKAATLTDDPPRGIGATAPIASARSAVAPAVTRPSSRRTGTNSRTGSSRYSPSAPGRPLRSAMSRSDKPHQRAEGRLDGAEVDRGARQQEDTSRGIIDHQRSISPSRRPPFRRSRRSRRAIWPIVALVIVSQEVQQAVQRQNPQALRALGLPPRAWRLRHAPGDDDVAEKWGLWSAGPVRRLRPGGCIGWKRQHVRRVVLAAR